MSAFLFGGWCGFIGLAVFGLMRWLFSPKPAKRYRYIHIGPKSASNVIRLHYGDRLVECEYDRAMAHIQAASLPCIGEGI